MGALGMLETSSIAKGMEAADAMLKAAKVDLVLSATTCPGKYLTVVAGEVANIEASIRAGESSAGGDVVDRLILANIHPSVQEAMAGVGEIGEITSLGVIETFSVSSCIVAADLAAKAAMVQLIELRPGHGIGGRAYVTMAGEVAAVEASVGAGSQYAEGQGLLVRSVVIPRLHADLKQAVV